MAGERWVRDIRERETVRGRFAALTKTVREARNGKPYLTVDLGDRTGSIEARVWDDAEAIAALFTVGDVVAVQGQASSYQGKLQLSLAQVERVPPGDIVLEDFQAQSDFDLDEMFQALRREAAQVGCPFVRRLLLAILDDPEVGPRYRTAPAAKYMHHAFLGGLVEHSLSMCLSAQKLHAHYERLLPGLLDRDLLVAGAILHDLGKVYELTVGVTVDYGDDGKLLGHIIQGTELVTRFAAAIPGFPPETLSRLKHLILAHHGKLEWGAAKTPAMGEAYVLHIVDLLDARLSAFYQACRTPPIAPWTPYLRMMEGSVVNPFHLAPEDEAGQRLLPERDPQWMHPATGANPDPATASASGRRKRRGRDADDTPSESQENLRLF